jgi:hypothetical protein
LRRVDRLELAVDIDLFQLVDQDQRRVAPGRHIARSNGDSKPLVGAVAERLHDLSRFDATLRDIGAVARQRLQHLGRMPHNPSGGGSIGPPIAPCPWPMMSMTSEYPAPQCSPVPGEGGLVAGELGIVAAHTNLGA